LKAGDLALRITGMSSPSELALLEELHQRCEGDTDTMLDALLESDSKTGLVCEAGSC
jgi:hypothetical protein